MSAWVLAGGLLGKAASWGGRGLVRWAAPLVDIGDTLDRIADRPRHLGIEGTNACNARCRFCGYPYQQRPRAVLAMDLFKKAIDEFDAFGGGSVGFNPVVGDTLVDPHILARIRYARGKQNISRIGLYSNGILLSQVGAGVLLSSGIDDVTISVGGLDRETYRRVFGVDRWHLVYDGLHALLEENEAQGYPARICIALRADVPIWQSLRAPAYRALRVHEFKLEFNLRHFDNWGGRIGQERLSGTMRLKKLPRKHEPCSILYRAPKVLSNGNLTLCGCRDLDGNSELVLGSVADRRILEMWRDPRVTEIRQGFYHGRVPRICRDCSLYQDLGFFRRQQLAALFRRQREKKTETVI
jgi:sulfatase maturation enzyme AslB (radical SAM superfamily)